MTLLVEDAAAQAFRIQEVEFEHLSQAEAGITAGREALKFAAQLKAALKQPRSQQRMARSHSQASSCA